MECAAYPILSSLGRSLRAYPNYTRLIEVLARRAVALESITPAQILSSVNRLQFRRSMLAPNAEIIA